MINTLLLKTASDYDDIKSFFVDVILDLRKAIDENKEYCIKNLEYTDLAFKGDKFVYNNCGCEDNKFHLNKSIYDRPQLLGIIIILKRIFDLKEEDLKV